MKQLFFLAILAISFTAARSQTDSLQNKDSLHQNLRPTTIFPEKLVLHKQESFSLNSFYYPAEYKNNYNRYRYPERNSVQETTAEIVGNIFLSILAGKTNHVYHPQHSK